MLEHRRCRNEARLSGKGPAVAKSPTTALKLPATLGSAVAFCCDRETLVGDSHRRAANRRVYPTASGRRSGAGGARHDARLQALGALAVSLAAAGAGPARRGGANA